jgi:hypothetical protein
MKVKDMTGCLARYAKNVKPEKPLSEVREQVWKEVTKDKISGAGRRGEDMSELLFQYRNELFKDLEEKCHHLFETDENGKILRGIEVDSGWRRVVENLLEKFEYIRTDNTHVLNPEYDSTRKPEDGYLVTPCIPGPDHVIKIYQIKQKFAELRCYVTVSEDSQGIAKEQVDWAIAYAAGQAALTCELCGRVGNRDGTAPEPTKN